MKSELLAELNSQPWAMLPDALQTLAHRIHAANSFTIEAAQQRQTATEGMVAVLPVSGPIMSRDSLIARVFGLPTSEGIAKQVQALAADPSVGVIVLDMDTPGGSALGVQEAAEAIASVRGRKKVVAVSNHLMASAGYWLGAAADEIIASPSSLTGSIGVIATHISMARYLSDAGIDVTLIRAGKYKAEGNQFEPLTEEARESMQGLVDQIYSDFVSSVAKYRDAKPSEVRSGYGEGRVLTAKDALSAGLVDRIETLDSVIARLSASRRAQSPRRRMAAELALHEAI